MSYPKDLPDYSDAELIRELERRKDARKRSVCDYCGRFSADKPCRHRERHKLART